MCLFGMNIALQLIQVGLRALIIDKCPTEQLPEASAWVARMNSLSSVFTYSLGLSKLQHLISALEKTRMQSMSLVACFVLLLTTLITCLSVKEEVKLSAENCHNDEPQISTWAHVKAAFSNVSETPKGFMQICIGQFFSWMGWFVFLVYASSYIGEVYVCQQLLTAKFPDAWRTQRAILVDKATNNGSAAMLYYSLVAMFAGIILPLLTGNSPALVGNLRVQGAAKESSLSHFSLLGLWAVSQGFFAFLMFLCLTVTSLYWATALVSLIGITWACTTSIPFALVSTYIAEQSMSADAGEVLSPGTVMALHNLAISAPQIFAASIYSIVLGSGGTELRWLMGAAGLASIAASVAIRNVGKNTGTTILKERV